MIDVVVGLIEELKAAKGSVVNVTSIAGSRVHPFAGAAYSTSKAALAALTGAAALPGTDSRRGADLLLQRRAPTRADAATARIEAHERVSDERWSALDYRLGHIEASLERLERRIWVMVFGVAAFLLAQGAEALVTAALVR